MRAEFSCTSAETSATRRHGEAAVEHDAIRALRRIASLEQVDQAMMMTLRELADQSGRSVENLNPRSGGAMGGGPVRSRAGTASKDCQISKMLKGRESPLRVLDNFMRPEFTNP